MGGRVIIRSSHTRFKPPGAPKKFHAGEAKAVLPSRTWRNGSVAAKKKPASQKDKVFHPPPDGIVRAVASIASKVHRTSPRIERFDKVLKTYCGMVVGFTDRYSVEEYLYLRLKQEIEARKKGNQRSLARSDLERLAERAILEAEATILAMVDFGRRLKHESAKGYKWVKATIGERCGEQCFFTLGLPKADGHRPILSLQTRADFRRTMKRRLTRDRDYRNQPPYVRH